MPPRSKRLLAALSLASVLLGAGCAAPRSPSRAARVHLFETNDAIRVEFDGKLFTEYHFRDVSRPYLYPLLGPDGEHFTRRWPQETVPDEEHDHPHHHALWFAHGDVNGVDLWSETDKAGRTVHQYFLEQKSGPDQGMLSTRNEWRAKDGKLLGHDERTLVFHRPTGPERIVDCVFKVIASEGELVLGDTKEGTFAIRVAESMRVTQPKNKPGQGHMVSSTGEKDGAVWGKRADWVDYFGPVEGKTRGIAIFDDPRNPRHPTWWHARDYGLFAANPFGLHDFEKREKGAGNMKIPAGGTVTFRYRVILHPGDERQAGIAKRYAEYVRQTKGRP